MSLPQPPAPDTDLRCYRHPTRETGRRCTRCGKPACSECLVQATVGSHCLECSTSARPAATVRAHDWNAGQAFLMTKVLIGLNLAVFVYMALRDAGTLSGKLTQAHIDLGLNRTLLRLDHHWYQLVTAGFIHFGIFHIVMNMFLLYQLGQLLEPALGRANYLLLYMASLVGGSAGALLIERGVGSITGGASGAVFGLMGAAAIGLHRRGVNVFSTGIGTTLMLNLVLTFSISGISIGGHIGGVVAGGICGYVMLAPTWRPLPTWSRWAAPLVVGAAAAAVAVVVVANTALPPGLR